VLSFIIKNCATDLSYVNTKDNCPALRKIQGQPLPCT